MTPWWVDMNIGGAFRVTSFRAGLKCSKANITSRDIPMIKTASAAFALAIALSMIVPILVTNQPAQAGCERVYTRAGWISRCS